MTRTCFRGAIFHMLRDPSAAPGEDAYAYFPDGLLVVEDGHVTAAGDYRTLAPTLAPQQAVEHFPDSLIVPGLIDTHIHYPQTDMIAAGGKDLLDWLETYTFPTEIAFGDPKVAADTASFFIRELLRNGTTTAMVYATVHKASVEALFEEARARNMRLIAGKVLMDRHAPAALLDRTPAQGDAESRALIKAWHGQGRLAYAVTPRFAVTSSPEQLRLCGALLDEHPDVYLQTHLSETVREVERVASLFPDARDYLNVYERFGLVRNRSVFAHGIHLEPDAFARLARAQASLAFCPTSNLFLGSGLFNLRAAQRHGVKTGLATDVGGGTSFSLWQTMNEAYKVCQLRGETPHPLQAFYLATLGGAAALNLTKTIGNFEPGKEADFLVVDTRATPLLARRMSVCRSIEEQLLVLSILADDRAIARTYVAGQLVHRRDLMP